MIIKSIAKIGSFLLLFSSQIVLSQTVIKPFIMSNDDLAGGLFKQPEALTQTHENGNVTVDVTSMLSSDRKFASGVYSSGKTTFEITDSYGVDEFMYFLSGSITLTSTDGSAVTVEAGESVTLPKEWAGKWSTEGYTKIWVIYSADGSGLE
jgi:uncharacterized cupin superfamily protein|tara:strand:+ start:2475 stop:2927 length:453 start_codon:yes stop_codon:yes gene_type:complete